MNHQRHLTRLSVFFLIFYIWQEYTNESAKAITSSGEVGGPTSKKAVPLKDEQLSSAEIKLLQENMYFSFSTLIICFQDDKNLITFCELTLSWHIRCSAPSLSLFHIKRPP
ncbi:hypothetical protein L6452_40220 [Arctium lappa]|uniref:Uncharacterized protein n=1 Tax=Arctium lappa TaxID=4217 RepID=A0ACB8XM39_ARCLA|nr:hypothetical protein L6452_40220 [Arctium lappa]